MGEKKEKSIFAASIPQKKSLPAVFKSAPRGEDSSLSFLLQTSPALFSAAEPDGCHCRMCVWVVRNSGIGKKKKSSSSALTCWFDLCLTCCLFQQSVTTTTAATTTTTTTAAFMERAPVCVPGGRPALRLHQGGWWARKLFCSGCFFFYLLDAADLQKSSARLTQHACGSDGRFLSATTLTSKFIFYISAQLRFQL